MITPQNLQKLHQLNLRLCIAQMQHKKAKNNLAQAVFEIENFVKNNSISIINPKQ